MQNLAIHSADSPKIWLLQGARLGDNQQVLALGAALEARFGWQPLIKQVKFRAGPIPGPDLAHALDHLDVDRSDSLIATPESPWPDLVIAIGRRTAPVARWIKSQNDPVGVHIQLGRFQDPFTSVDLLVTTAQYGLPKAANVLHLSLPITARKPQILAAAAAAFSSDFADITGPLIGVLAGGPSNPIQFGADDARRLVRESLAFAASRAGTLLVATSPRTPAAVLEVLKRDLPAPHRLFAFEAGAGARNPYPALLALAQAFIVTTDSVSMVADACLTGREVRLFDLPVAPRRPLWQPSLPVQHWVGRRRIARLSEGKPVDALDQWYDGEVRAARAQPTRYVPVIMNRLLREGHVALLSGPSSRQPRCGQLGIDRLVLQELDMVVARILALLAERRAVSLRDRLAEGGGLAARAARPGIQIGSFDPAIP